jgi:hypothetical protein
MFDLSSKGMAMLFHANEDCPHCDQSITANFGVPHFDAHGSFDTAFFNRVARVCRVDSLTSQSAIGCRAQEQGNGLCRGSS